jgi:hypothetical protein
MRRKWLRFVACASVFVTILLSYPDRTDPAKRLSKVPQSSLDADPNLKLVSESSPHMRTER